MKRITGLLASVLIPLGSPSDWQELKFSKIKPNQNSFSAQGLEVKVEHSSSPLIYPLPQPLKVSAFSVELEIEGEMNSPGAEFPEDAYLRLGLVAPGTRRLNMIERMAAADWIKKLFSLAPKDSGVDKIYFYNLAERGLGQKRVFPNSKELMTEELIAVRDKSAKNITFQHQLAQPIPVVALWLSIDGDDTRSSYKLRIKSIKLTAEPPKQLDLEKSE